MMVYRLWRKLREKEFEYFESDIIRTLYVCVWAGGCVCKIKKLQIGFFKFYNNEKL